MSRVSLNSDHRDDASLAFVVKPEASLTLNEAAQFCRQALAINPLLVDAHNNLGNLMKAQGLIQEGKSQQNMTKNNVKRKGASLPPAQLYSVTLREESSGRKQNNAKRGEKGVSTNKKSMLKVQHLKSLAKWASQEASIPSLGAFFGHCLMKCGEPDPSFFPCQRCETILQPGQNCTVRIEPNRARSHASRKCKSTKNNVVYKCHICDHCSMKRGTPKDHMKEICPKVKQPSQVPKHAHPTAQKAADPEPILQNEICKPDGVTSSLTTAIDSPETPTAARDTPITKSPATLLGGKRRKRNKPGPNKQAETGTNSASADSLKSVSTANKRRRKSWTSLREIAETSEQGSKTQNIATLAIPFFL